MSDEEFMRLALAAARQGLLAGQAPFGAVLVRDGQPLAEAHNLVWQEQDVTAHAEVRAIRAACTRLGTLDLSGCTLYSTCEPCPMCFTAAHDARVGRIVCGARLTDAAEFGYLGLQVPLEILLRASLRPLQVAQDVLRGDCLDLFRSVPTVTFPARCLHHLFEEQAARRPLATALSCAGTHWTYAELDARANRLANHLRALGAGPEVLVGLAVPHSADTVLGMLAILKAGAAYVPLDPSYPRERLARVLADSRAPLVITHAGLRERLSAAGPRWVLLDQDAALIDGQSSDRPEVEVTPENLSYVMYTSGSAGTPKGVLVTHANVARLFPAMSELAAFDPADVWTLCHSASFGFSVWEIWGALAHGARLVVVPREVSQSPEALHELVCRERVTVLSQTPSAFRLFDWADEGSRSALRPALRLIAFSGEPLRPAALRPWILRHGAEQPALVNTYAITETAGQVLCRRVREDDLQQPDRSLVGRPLRDVQLYLLDPELRPVPAGATGELYIGGPAIARGYLNRPELTQARFLPDPINPQSGTRFYRTGDLARRLGDGEIEFTGRADDQVKVRGYRIEPAEIEGCLRDHPALSDAVVTAAGDGTEEGGYLVAHVVPQPDTLSPRPAASSAQSEENVPELWPSVGEYNAYDDFLYYLMGRELSQQPRFRDMVARHAPGKVVADVGTGPEVALARLCVEAGAQKVYALELLEDVARQAEAAVTRLALDRKITVLAGDARTAALPSPVDVIVSRLMGNIGSADGLIPILNGARRWLRPGGVILPQVCVTRIGVASLPEALRGRPRFTRLASYYVEKLFEQVGRPFDMRLCLRNIPPSAVVSNVATFEALDFSAPVDPAGAGSAEFVIAADGLIDGFLLWLTSSSGDEEVTNYLEAQSAWLPVFFPAFDPAVAVSAGDVVRAEWTRRPSADGVHPDYDIRGALIRGDGRVAQFAYTSPYRPAGHRQTPFYERLFGGGHRPVRRAVTVAELRAHLQERLPEYMVPSRFVFLDELPRLPNGKLDRRSLPTPDGGQADAGAPYAAPRTPFEEKLADIWAELLGRERVGIHDNFFALGGHSLLAMQVVSRARTVFGAELPVRSVFEAPTVAQLAERLLQALLDEGTTPAALAS